MRRLVVVVIKCTFFVAAEMIIDEVIEANINKPALLKFQ